jgi:1,4-dihydroxy-2-naphthoate octaprenyltransferase
MVNNIRDRADDLRAGRRTLAGLVSAGTARHVYTILMLAPYGLLPLLAGHHPGVLVALAALPASLVLVARLRRHPGGPAMNPLLVHTAQCGLGFGCLLALAIAGWGLAGARAEAGFDRPDVLGTSSCALTAK